MISIVLPYVMDRGWLKEAIASAENQTFKDYELIVQQSGFSISKNYNTAIKRAKGEYIKLFADDDIMLPDCLQVLYDKIIQGYDFVCADGINFDEDEEMLFHGRECTLAQLLEHNDIHGGTMLYSKKALYEVGGFDENLWMAQEYDLNLKLLKNGYKLGYVPKTVYRYRIHDGQNSHMPYFFRIKTIEQIRNRYRCGI